MNPLYEMIFYAIMFIIIIGQLSSRDENGMYGYDRTYGVAGDGRTRGMFGTIYNADGSYSFKHNILDTNPMWW